MLRRFRRWLCRTFGHRYVTRVVFANKSLDVCGRCDWVENIWHERLRGEHYSSYFIDEAV